MSESLPQLLDMKFTQLLSKEKQNCINCIGN